MPLTNSRACLYTPPISNFDVSLRLISLKKKRNVNEEENDAPRTLTHQTKHVHRKRETTTRVELNSIEEEETFEAETEEESCDSERSDESDDELVDVDKAEVEGEPTPFDDFIDFDVLFPNHV
ncbi:PREDICTED: uncharacterized protein LOC108663327 [Theobroma cacao]|uniref:Uncharacterized protein LOC108663327 n=1 Tax=Theobroma cacao TaxID=3641 RepID=A0AB32WSP1_THECC|nr:PREDICTED: uncharacterized protein LOC108663327 [Theobroma cacao]